MGEVRLAEELDAPLALEPSQHYQAHLVPWLSPRPRLTAQWQSCKVGITVPFHTPGLG